MKTLVAVLLAVSVCALPTGAQTQKIGYVNSAKIFDDLSEARDITKRLEALAKPIQDSLQLMQKDIEAKVEDYQKKESMLNDAAKRAAVQEVQDLQQRAREYAQR